MESGIEEFWIYDFARLAGRGWPCVEIVYRRGRDFGIKRSIQRRGGRIREFWSLEYRIQENLECRIPSENSDKVTEDRIEEFWICDFRFWNEKYEKTRTMILDLRLWILE
jgi:hypothetical protein